MPTAQGCMFTCQLKDKGTAKFLHNPSANKKHNSRLQLTSQYTATNANFRYDFRFVVQMPRSVAANNCCFYGFYTVDVLVVVVDAVTAFSFLMLVIFRICFSCNFLTQFLVVIPKAGSFFHRVKG